TILALQAGGELIEAVLPAEGLLPRSALGIEQVIMDGPAVAGETDGRGVLFGRRGVGYESQGVERLFSSIEGAGAAAVLQSPDFDLPIRARGEHAVPRVAAVGLEVRS